MSTWTHEDWLSLVSLLGTWFTGVFLVIATLLLWRVTKRQQEYAEQRDTAMRTPRLGLVSREDVKVEQVVWGKLEGHVISWEIGLHNGSEVPIVARRFQLDCVGAETNLGMRIQNLKLVDDKNAIVGQNIEVRKDKSEVVLRIVLDDPDCVKAFQALRLCFPIYSLGLTVQYRPYGGDSDLVSDRLVSSMFQLRDDCRLRALEEHCRIL